MGSTALGLAHVVFGADTQEFDTAAKGVRGVLADLMNTFRDVERQITKVGTAATVGITLPFAALVRTAAKGARTFESEMKKVESALGDISPKTLDDLSKAARDLGPRVGKSATEAASGLDSLARAGMGVEDILSGGLEAALALSAAGQTDVSTAAETLTDVMGQFELQASDLPMIVRNIVGGLDATKFSMNDFVDALAQGGGVVAAGGSTFTEFATAISAVATQFKSGSDAGTSLKTYISTLTGKSKEAKKEIEALGLSFYNADGSVKSFADQAEMLQNVFGEMSDRDITEKLQTLFGTDAVRVAIGLIRQGRQGIEDLQSTIMNGDVDKKIAVVMEGSEAASKRIGNAWEQLKLRLMIDTGLLDMITAIKNGFATLLEWISKLPTPVLQVMLAIGALLSVLGPLLLAAKAIAVVFFARWVAAFGLIGRVIALIISPLQVLIGVFAEFATANGAMAAVRLLGTSLLRLLGPVGIAISIFLAFKDEVIRALTDVWKSAEGTLGPKFRELFTRLADIGKSVIATFNEIAASPLGQAIGKLIELVGELVYWLVYLGGSAIVGAISALLDILNVLAELIQTVGTVLNHVIHGEWAKAWAAAGNYAENSMARALRAVINLIPGLKEALWLIEKITGKSLLPKEGAPPSGASGKAPWWKGSWWNGSGEPAATAGGTGGGGPEDTKKAGKSGGGGSAGGPSADEIARRREALRLQQALDVARASGDIEAQRQLEREIELSSRVSEYEELGLSNALAKVAAERDLQELDKARAIAAARELAQDEASFNTRLAELRQDHEHLRTLEDDRFLQGEIERYRRSGLSLAEAELEAANNLKSLDTERANALKRRQAAEEGQRQLELARLRGDRDAEIRTLERKLWIEDRIRQIRADSDGKINETRAREIAESEDSAYELARRQGEWRDVFHGAIRAAMDGNLGSFVKDWWREKLAKALENAINSISDLLFKVFQNAMSGAAGGGGGGVGGLLGKIFGIGVSALGGAGGGAAASLGRGASTSLNTIATAKFPGFKTGGSFKVGGMSGIDRNLVSIRATKGEIVDIRRPGNDNGGGNTVIMHNDFRGADAGAVAGISAKLDQLDRSLEGRAIGAVADARDRRFIR